MMEKTIAVNTTSHLYTIREFLPAMIDNKKGHVVSIASVAGTVGIAGMADYCASKFGAFAIDESLRMEMQHMGLSDKIKTTCICPYYINTGMFDGVKTNFLFPILDQHVVTKRIIDAIRQEEPLVLIPATMYVVFFGRTFFPVWFQDWLTRATGSNNSMDDFKGSYSSTAPGTLSAKQGH